MSIEKYSQTARFKATTFELGDWVIETKGHRSGSVIAIIPEGYYAICDLYVVEFDGSYEIFDSQTLITYDKYYWDNLEESDNG